jgi:hypothetical protein
MQTDDLRRHLSVLAGKAAPPADRARLLEAMGAVDTWLRTAAVSVDPQLRHFLENRSYLKAWHYLDSPPRAARN